jgi:hypothetical protein
VSTGTTVDPDQVLRREVMETPRWRRQNGLIREALYIFLGVALTMAVLLDGVAIVKAQATARDVASDAGSEARVAYTNTGDVNQAKQAAKDHAENSDAVMIDFSVQPQLTNTPTFTVTVQAHTDTYLFKYIKYIPGLKDWAHKVQNPVITRSTSSAD